MIWGQPQLGVLVAEALSQSFSLFWTLNHFFPLQLTFFSCFSLLCVFLFTIVEDILFLFFWVFKAHSKFFELGTFRL